MRQVMVIALPLLCLPAMGCLVESDDDLFGVARGGGGLVIVEETVRQDYALWDFVYDEVYYEEDVYYDDSYYYEDDYYYSEGDLYYFEEDDHYSENAYNVYDDPFFDDPWLDPFYYDGAWLEDEFDDFEAEDDYFFGWP